MCESRRKIVRVLGILSGLDLARSLLIRILLHDRATDARRSKEKPHLQVKKQEHQESEQNWDQHFGVFKLRLILDENDTLVRTRLRQSLDAISTAVR